MAELTQVGFQTVEGSGSQGLRVGAADPDKVTTVGPSTPGFEKVSRTPLGSMPLPLVGN